MDKLIKFSFYGFLPLVKNSISEKFAICKDSKTNALSSNANQNKRIEIAYRDKTIMKKYRFKRSHNKRKINDNAPYKISVKNKTLETT